VDSIGWNFGATRNNGSTITECKKKKLISSPNYGIHSSPVNFRLVFNSLLDLREVGCGGTDWTDLAEDRVGGTCECGNEIAENRYGSQEGMLQGVNK
jgi:hypothetical protein